MPSPSHLEERVLADPQLRDLFAFAASENFAKSLDSVGYEVVARG
jgi:hypothetical protein